ncbi:MAG: sigma factor [Blastocatellia bacterium]
MLGLLDAVEKYDEMRGVQFKTYAETRIRGAMLDSLRDLDWSSRSLRSRAREIEVAARKIEQEKGRMAEEEERRQNWGWNFRPFKNLLGELTRVRRSSNSTTDEKFAGHERVAGAGQPERSPCANTNGRNRARS